MCNKLNRLNMGENFIFLPSLLIAPSERAGVSECERSLNKYVSVPIVQSVAANSSFNLNMKKKKVIESNCNKCTRTKVRINKCMFIVLRWPQTSATSRSTNDINLKNVTNYRTDFELQKWCNKDALRSTKRRECRPDGSKKIVCVRRRMATSFHERTRRVDGQVAVSRALETFHFMINWSPGGNLWMTCNNN